MAFGLTIDPDTLVSALTRFEQSAVEIVRALAAIDNEDVHLLVLDEPTSSMGAAEVQQLFTTLRQVKDMGIAVLYVSHTLPEVLEIADRVTVLRDGRIVADRDVAEITEKELIELIVGHSIEHASPPAPRAEGEAPILAVHELTLGGLQKASFAVCKHEILGITGLIGSGYEQVGRCLSGFANWEHGTVVIDGKPFEQFTPGTAIRAGLVAMPADRTKAGLIPQFTIAENVTLPDMSFFWKHGRLNYKAERADVLHWIRATGVVPPDPGRLVQELSGGNQQKVLLAKALRLRPRVLCLSEPTQAVDVGAAATIRHLITDLATDDRAIVVCSSDAEELVQVCQRVLITRGGHIATELTGDEITEDRIIAESQFEGSAR
jgi:ribose transport system ATP-binding protein